MEDFSLAEKLSNGEKNRKILSFLLLSSYSALSRAFHSEKGFSARFLELLSSCSFMKIWFMKSHISQCKHFLGYSASVEPTTKAEVKKFKKYFETFRNLKYSLHTINMTDLLF